MSLPLLAGVRELTLGMCDVLGAHGAHASIRGLAQDLAALGRLTLLQAPRDVVAALPPALGGLIELRVHEQEKPWKDKACPDMGAACFHRARHVTTRIDL